MAGRRVEIEQELAVLKTLFHNAPVGLAFLSREFRYLHVNEVLAVSHALTIDAHIGKTVEEVVPRLWPTLKPLFERALAGETILNVDVGDRSGRSNGHRQLASCYAIRLEDGIVGLGLIVHSITERRRDEDELRRSEASLVNAQRIAKIGSWDQNVSTGAISWSRQMYEIFGVGETTPVTYEWFLERVHPEDRAGRHAAQQAALSGAGCLDLEYRIVLPDGSIKTVHATGELTRDAAGRPAHLAGTVRDVAERKQAEVAASRMAAIVEASDDAIIAKDLDGIITSWNRSAERIFGYAAEDMVGTSILRLIPNDRHGEEQRILGTIRRGERVPQFETVRRTKDGRLIDVLIAASPIQDATGLVVGASKTARDITEYKKAEAARRASEARYRTLFEHAPDGILIADVDGRFLDANASMCRMLGYAREELIGKRAADILAPQELSEIAPGLDAILSTSGHPRERQFQRYDGSYFPGDTIGTTMPDGNRLIVVRDVTERKRAAQALEQSEREARVFAEELAVEREHLVTAQAVAKMGSWTTDLLTMNVTWSAETHRIFETDSSTIIPTHARFLELVHPDDRAAVDRAFVQSLERHAMASIEHRVALADGRVKTVVESWQITRDPDGAPLLAIGTTLDITERKAAEERVRTAAARLRAVVSNAPLVVFAVNDQGVFTLSEGKGLEGVGLAPGQVVGQSAMEMYADIPIVQADGSTISGKDAIRRVLAGETISGLTTLGQDYFENRFVPDRDSEGRVTGMIGVATVVTERRRADEALRESEARLRRSMADLQAVSARLNEAREQERGKIARDIHDQLGQALTALKMDVVDLRRRLDAGDTTVIRERLAEMLALIDTSVNEVRRVASELRPVVLDDLGFVAAMRAYFIDVERRAKIRCVLSTALTELTIADDRATALFRILQEALTNVLRHADATRVDISLSVDAGFVRLAVHDNGKGLPPAALRTPRSLGLTGMQDRALLFGGDVRVSGGPDQGTTVTVDLPIAGEAR